MRLVCTIFFGLLVCCIIANGQDTRTPERDKTTPLNTDARTAWDLLENLRHMLRHLLILNRSL